MWSQSPSQKNKDSHLKEQFWDALSKGRFDLCYEIYKKTDYRKMFEILVWGLAHDKETLLPYAFVWYLLTKEESVKVHYIGAYIFFHGLNYLPHAYELGLYHQRRASELEPENLEHKELMLFYNDVPERSLRDEEAREIALEILQKNPNLKWVRDQLEYIEARLEEKRKKKSKKAQSPRK